MTTVETRQKPLPKIRPETETYWAAAKRHQLVLQKCRACDQLIFFPRLVCHSCLSRQLQWIKASGRGTVYSFTIMHRTIKPGFSGDIPYVYAIIELAEGVRMISNVIGTEPCRVRIGMPVKVCFDDLTSEITVPRFKPCN